MSQTAPPFAARDPEVEGLSAAASGANLFVLKQGDTFLVADVFGDVRGEADGLFHNDTRVLSRLRLLLGGGRPSLLAGAVSQEMFSSPRI